MTDREKLIELLKVPIYPHLDADPAEVVADYLLDNGVTFAKDANAPSKWISVGDRLPDDEFEELTNQTDWDVYPCLCAVKNHVSGIRYVTKVFYDGGNFVNDELVRYTASVTHWMPLPEPPKEV